jgi:hypothetical protein
MLAAYVRTAQVRLPHMSERLRKVEADRTRLCGLHHGSIPVVSHVSFLVKILSALTRNATLSSSKLSAVSQTIFAYSSILSVFYLDVALEDLLVHEFEERAAFLVYDKIYGYRPTRSSSVVSFRTQMYMILVTNRHDSTGLETPVQHPQEHSYSYDIPCGISIWNVFDLRA